MINIEISKNKQLKETIKKLKKDLKILKIIRDKDYKCKKYKLKALIKKKKVDYIKTKVIEAKKSY